MPCWKSGCCGFCFKSFLLSKSLLSRKNVFLKEVLNEGQERTQCAGVGREKRAEMLRSSAGTRATERDGDVILPSL